ncbi:MAG: divalent-cation tolerance protein CutA [Nitrospirales bacterium]|nr:divalent-cation tolerance protein CutA [Nitrospira sp.]MDR4501257.1 divalent-cation tolerance protein CutA [Nitrospirales bacterium]
MSQEIVVLVTAGSEDEARNIAKIIVQKGLVACVNIIPKIQSVFTWDGAVTEEQESLLIAKTTMKAFEKLESAIKTLHSYSVPEIIALPIHAGSLEYLSWVRETVNTKEA